MYRLTWCDLFNRLIISSSDSNDPLAAAPQGEGKEPCVYVTIVKVKINYNLYNYR